jgi:hypothetical protein
MAGHRHHYDEARRLVTSDCMMAPTRHRLLAWATHLPPGAQMKITQMNKPATATIQRLMRGQSIVEFALILPIFLALIFGIIEIGRAWAAKQGLTLASNEGARILAAAHGPGLLYNSTSAKQAAAIKIASEYLLHAGLPPSDETKIVAVRFLPGGDKVLGTADDEAQSGYNDAVRGDRVGISIKYKFETPLPILLKMFEDGVDNAAPQGAIQMGVISHLTHE